MTVPTSASTAAVRLQQYAPSTSAYFDNPVSPPLIITTSGVHYILQGTTIVNIGSLGGGPGAVNWGSIGGTLSSQTDLQSALDAKLSTSAATTFATAAQVTNYAWTSSLGTAATTFASTYALATQVTNFAWTSTLGDAATTFASTYARAAQVTNFAWTSTLGDAATTFASTYARAAQTTNFAWTSSLGTAATTAASTYATAVQVTNYAWTSTLGSAATTFSSTYGFAAQTSNYAWNSTFATFLTQQGANIALGTNIFSTVASTTLSAGTWEVNAMCLVGKDVSTTAVFTAKITDGTNNYASAQEWINAGPASTYVSLQLMGLITLGAASTISLQVASNQSSCVATAAARQNQAGSTATQMISMRIK